MFDYFFVADSMGLVVATMFDVGLVSF